MAKARSRSKRSSEPVTRYGARDAVLPALATSCILLLFLVLFGPAHRDAAVLKARGIDAVGTISSITVHPGHTRSSAYSVVRYRFAAGPRMVEGERILKEREEDRVRGRSTVPIIYDPEDPWRSAVDFDNAVRRAHPDLEFALGVLAGIGAIVLIWWASTSLWRNKPKPMRLPDRL